MDKNKLIERQKKIRNFSIIAHIDHGKSTIADRILEYTNTLSERDLKDQVLDNMDIERERGITIKLTPCEVLYKADDGKEYILNLIDTPGHVDFTYEVSRSLAACEGALLVVDAAQSIQAQTLANAYLAIDNNLEIIPVINKIDLAAADPDRVKKDIEEVVGISTENTVLTSAKTGVGIKDILETIVRDVPAPKGDIDAPLQALIFDSYYDQYKGAIPIVRVINGTIKPKDEIVLMSPNLKYEVIEVGIYSPNQIKRDYLTVGDVGYIVAGIKEIESIHVGDTITKLPNKAKEKLPGYRKLNPMVYSGMFPVDNKDYLALKEALEKLILNDSSLTYELESSQALGFGFRVGFLGLLHMDVIQERIEREYDIALILTAPSVHYKVIANDDSVYYIDNPALLPDANLFKYIEEPFVKVTIMTPNQYVGDVMNLCQSKRGTFKNMHYVTESRVNILYEMPLSEIIFDFFDRLKSQTKGYASYDYEFLNYQSSNLVRMDILINGEKLDALAMIIHKDEAYKRGSGITRKLKDVIPRQMFEVPIQAAIGNKIIARTNVKALRKDVIAKCYGGDITRKKKLLEKQKEGKKRMKAVGNVEIPQEAFLAVLSIKDE
jgi:GTP-binding protein LepA